MILHQTPQQAAQWLLAHGAVRLCADSRILQAGDAFLAWPGAKFDARAHVDRALALGCPCLIESAEAEQQGANTAVAAMHRLKGLAGQVADHFYGQPSAKLPVVAITGTNGKTSTAWWLSQALSLNSQLLHNSEQRSELIRRQKAKNTSKTDLNCLMVGTLGYGEPPHVSEGSLTTPSAVELHTWIAHALEQGATSVVMEASSVGIVEQRMAGIAVHVAVFTNLTQDHLDYHGSMDAYWQAKRSLFSLPTLRAAVVNVDDAKGAAMAAELHAKAGLDVWTVSASSARITAQGVQTDAQGLRFQVVEQLPDGNKASARVRSGAFGQFNLLNLLGVVAAQRALGIELDSACEVIERLLPVPGRMQAVTPSTASKAHPLVLVDYAHTPDALTQVLGTCRELAVERRGKVSAVFGCGGNRDRSKRPLMARAVELGADRVVLTQDNPRTESLEQIEADVLAGFAKPQAVSVQPDRTTAIAVALTMCQANDLLLIAGKGHESYQDIGGMKRPHSDLLAAQNALDTWCATHAKEAHA